MIWERIRQGLVLISLFAVGVLAWHAIEQGSELKTAQGQLKALINSRHADALQREAENKEHQRNAAVNRGINVERWCEGKTPEAASLNGIVRFNQQFVRGITNGQLTYALQPNNCEQIVAETLESSTHKPVITQKAYPLVYRALHPPVATTTLPTPTGLGGASCVPPNGDGYMGVCDPQREHPGQLKALAPSATLGGIQGVDVSNNNGATNFSSLRSHGIQFVYAKAEQQCFTDSELAHNAAGAAAEHMAFGIYSFIQPGRTSPASDAACMAARERSVLSHTHRTLPVVFDAESFNGLSGHSVCVWLHAAEFDLRHDLPGVLVGVYGSPGTLPDCEPNGTAAWTADWLVSFPAELPGYSSHFNWQWFGPRFASPTIEGMDRDKGSSNILSLTFPRAAPPSPAVAHARERRELAGHEAVVRQLRLQQLHLRQKLLKYGCDRRVKAHERTGIRCKGWKAAGGRVGVHGRREDAFIARLRHELGIR